VETRRLRGNFLMVYRNNAGRLGSGFISVCLETRWLGPKSGFYVPERPCNKQNKTGSCRLSIKKDSPKELTQFAAETSEKRPQN